jgi:hypothetical protein
MAAHRGESPLYPRYGGDSLSIRKQIRDRVKQVGSDKNGANTTGKQSRDLLTYMIEERPTGDSAWTEEDIHGHVSPHSCLEGRENCPIETLITIL